MSEYTYPALGGDRSNDKRFIKSKPVPVRKQKVDLARVEHDRRLLANPPSYLNANPKTLFDWKRNFIHQSSLSRSEKSAALKSARTAFNYHAGTEALGDLVFGKSLTNLAAHGDYPKTPGEAAGLAFGAATLIPPTKLAAGIRLAGEGAKVAVTSEGAGRLLAEQRGTIGPGRTFGNPEPTPPVAKPELPSVPPAVAPEEQLRQGMKGAMKGYKKQKVARSAALGQRSAAANEAYATVADPYEAHIAAKSALKGELPKNALNAVPEMTQEDLKQLMDTVRGHPTLLPLQKVTTNDALIKVFAGGQPAPHEIRLIEHVFGSDKTRRIAALTGGNWGDKVINALNIPRTLQSTLDISGLTRQAFVAMTTHPIIWGKASPSYIKAFRKGNFDVIEEAVKNDPLYSLALGHVSFSDMHGSLLAHEEAFASDYATKIPVVGTAIKGSAQGYQAFLNKLRMDMFSHFVRLEVKANRNPQREEFLKSVGDIVNAATGRGAIHGRLEHMMPAANTLLYSPRLMLSRLNYFDPTWYFRLKGRRARIEALKGLFATTAYVTSIVALLSQIPGVEVGSTDPLSADFGKLKQGNTRVDVAAGFLQYIHLAEMLRQNAKINSTTGEKVQLGSGYGVPTRFDQVVNFFTNKSAPPVSIGIGILKGHDAVGNPVTPLTIAHNSFIPLALQDAQGLYKEKKGGLDGITAATAGYGLSAIGLGLQTYGQKKGSVVTRSNRSSGEFSYPGVSSSGSSGGGFTYPGANP